MGVMRQTLRLIFNQITVDSYPFLFNRTAVSRATDSLTVPTLIIH